MQQPSWWDGRLYTAVYAQYGDPASRLIRSIIVVFDVQRSWNCKRSRLVNRSLGVCIERKRNKRERSGIERSREGRQGRERERLTCNALVQLRKSKQSNQRRRKKEEEEKVQERTNAEKKNRTRIRIRIIRMDNKQTLLKLKVEKKRKFIIINNKKKKQTD